MSAAGAHTHHAGNALTMLCTAPAALGRTGRARQATGEWDTASCASTKAVVCCKPPPDDFFDCGQNVQDESTEWCASFQTPPWLCRRPRTPRRLNVRSARPPGFVWRLRLRHGNDSTTHACLLGIPTRLSTTTAANVRANRPFVPFYLRDDKQTDDVPNMEEDIGEKRAGEGTPACFCGLGLPSSHAVWPCGSLASQRWADLPHAMAHAAPLSVLERTLVTCTNIFNFANKPPPACQRACAPSTPAVCAAAGFSRTNAYYIGNDALSKLDLTEAQLCVEDPATDKRLCLELDAADLNYNGQSNAPFDDFNGPPGLTRPPSGTDLPGHPCLSLAPTS